LTPIADPVAPEGSVSIPGMHLHHHGAERGSSCTAWLGAGPLARWILAACAACAVGACNNAESTTAPGTPGVLAVVTVAPAGLTLAAGGTLQLWVTPTDSTGLVIQGLQTIWSSSDTTIATVSSTGFVNSVAPGSVTITATTSRPLGEGGGQTMVGTAPITFAQFTLGSVSAGDGAAGLACGLSAGGAAYCWGDNSRAELGTKDTTNFSGSSTPTSLGAGLTFTATSVGSDFACAVTAAHAAYCWGNNSVGELGTGLTSVHSTPVAVTGGLSFTSVSAGGGFACGVAAAGAAYCWGAGAAGQLGNGASAANASPVAVAGGLQFATVSAGTGTACGVTTAAAAYCWGDNSYGQLGNGTMTGSAVPVAVSGGLTWAAISVGNGFVCGLSVARAAYCWGDDTYGELGTTTVAASTTPVAVAGGLTFAQLSAGGIFACGLAPNGVAYCWGDNSSGELGTGATTGSPTPVVVGATLAGGIRFSALTAGSDAACGVAAAGVYCWGDNISGQLGAGPIGPYSSTPLKVLGQP